MQATDQGQMGNSSRDRILERIRAGLRVPIPEAHANASEGAISASVIIEPVENPLERFQSECVANLMECALTADNSASARRLAEILQPLPAGEIFVQDDPVLRQLVEQAAPARAIRWSTQGGPAEASQATITLAEALIAQTGSILVSSSCGGRGASVIAPCHIVYATTGQLVPDLATALARVAEGRILDRNSFACVISGSSRTADIEKILVQGAHGPRRLAVILENAS